MVNPYEPTLINATEVSPSAELEPSLPKRLLWVLIVLYPFGAASTVYLLWGLAFLLLGHAPIPSVDDPQSITLPFSFLHLATVFVLSLFPALLPLGLAMSVLGPSFGKHRNAIASVRFCVLYLLQCLVIGALLRWDPGSVIEWLFD